MLTAAGSTVNISFNCSAITDAGENLVNVSLWLDIGSTGLMVFNSTNRTAATNNTGAYINVSNMPEGIHLWTCEATNMTGNKTRALSNRTIYIDVTKPHTINLSNALLTNGYNSSSNTLNFNWTAMDNVATNFLCNLSIGMLGNKTIMVSNGSLNNTQVANIPDGNYVWNVTCWDPTNMSSNTNTSETRRLTVDANAPELITPNVNNGSWWNSATVNFNWTATNTGTSVLYCNVTIDGVINSSTQTAASTVMARYSASRSCKRHAHMVFKL